MGSSDSTCCGSHPDANIPQHDTDVTSFKQNRRLHDFYKSKNMIEKSEGELTPVPPNEIVNALTMYRRQATELNTSYHQQYEDLLQCLIDDITEVNLAPQDLHSTGSDDRFSETKKTNKTNYNRISTQIEILNSEGWRAQSLLLCIKRVNIDEEKEYGLLSFLRNDLDRDSVDELFNKFPESESFSATQFVSLLTLTVIAYKIRTAHLLTRTSSDIYHHPDIDGGKVRASVQHLAIWCIRRFGHKSNKSKTVHVMDDIGNRIDGKYYAYKLNVNKQHYAQNLCIWIQEYIERDGYFDV